MKAEKEYIIDGKIYVTDGERIRLKKYHLAGYPEFLYVEQLIEKHQSAIKSMFKNEVKYEAL